LKTNCPKSDVVEEEVDSTIMMMLNAMSRRVNRWWIVPSKSRPYLEDERRVFYKDESPEGLSPAVIVTEDLLQQVVVIMPLDKFTDLLKLWKKANPKWVNRMRKVARAKQKCKENALATSRESHS
jgi:hypothetical protein